MFTIVFAVMMYYILQSLFTILFLYLLFYLPLMAANKRTPDGYLLPMADTVGTGCLQLVSIASALTTLLITGTRNC